MRSGRLHIGGFSTGPAGFAVNLAGAVPFAVKGDAEDWQGYNLIVVVRADSDIEDLADLAGRGFAHTSASSNSGNLAPMALFPDEGLTPGEDYEVLFSGGHDNSIMGVDSGDYDGAAVASDVFERMARRGQINADDFRIVYRSERFPTSSFAYDSRLAPELRDTILTCFTDYRFTEDMVVLPEVGFLSQMEDEGMRGRPVRSGTTALTRWAHHRRACANDARITEREETALMKLHLPVTKGRGGSHKRTFGKVIYSRSRSCVPPAAPSRCRTLCSRTISFQRFRSFRSTVGSLSKLL